MIQAGNLVKWYGPTKAVDNLTFKIEPGTIVGFLGPNGAGKSTTMRLLTGYLPPTSGTVSIAGEDVLANSSSARAKLGYLPESTPLYTEMRVDEYLHYRGQLHGMDRNQRKKRIGIVTDRCGLRKVHKRVISKLSKGNRQRVGLAQALLHEPAVLILDEPTAGLDPNQIQHVRKLINELRGEHTILLSTHILPEVEKTADKVMIIVGGKIVAEGTCDQLRDQARQGGRLFIEVKAAQEQVSGMLKTLNSVAGIETSMHEGWCRALITPKENVDIREQIGGALMSQSLLVREMRHETASLEQFFVEITSNQGQLPADSQVAN